MVFFCLSPANDIPKVNIPNLDKIAHTFFHFVLTLLWFLFLINQSQTKNKMKVILTSFCISVLFGVTIEIIQSQFTTTRSGDILDVVANMFGSILAIVVIGFYFRIKNQLNLR